ncbi:MAG: hypothetical protein PHP28_01780 [Actinomycetota bacterium]|nr:hypothetical protein [Actinomycetota bacterium]MDD5667711.1 hypothetical protein [Actinomycetota bacterium]
MQVEVDFCPECGIPEPFSQGQTWLNNGDVVQGVNPEARLGFVECEILDPLFANIGEIIGVSIEGMVVNITSRGTEKYMSNLIPASIKDMVQAKQMDPRIFLDNIMTYCHVIGFGRYEFVGTRYERDEDDYSITRVEAPFSVPEAAGGIAGVASALVGGEHAVSYREVSPGLFEYTTRWTEYPEVLVEKLQTLPYRHREGDMEMERCATCGLPKALRDYDWHLDRGLIVNGRTGRRMAVLGPELLDTLFEALEAELDETIPKAVVEAQRRLARAGFFSVDEVKEEEYFRGQLALRGMGNLREMDMSPRGMHLRIDNSAGSLLTVGKVQGLFEATCGVDSSVDWELSGEGNLEVEVKPRGVVAAV